MALLQFGSGKMPWSAIAKLSTRKGCMFACGWLPPTWRPRPGASAVGFAGAA